MFGSRFFALRPDACATIVDGFTGSRSGIIGADALEPVFESAVWRWSVLKRTHRTVECDDNSAIIERVSDRHVD